LLYWKSALQNFHFIMFYRCIRTLSKCDLFAFTSCKNKTSRSQAYTAVITKQMLYRIYYRGRFCVTYC
jgi:hypothetical protein